MVSRLRILLACLCLAFSVAANALNDPTVPTDPVLYFGDARSRGTSHWALQSILTASNRRIAVINGTQVREGDRIGGARVLRIHSSHVLLSTGSRTLKLRLLPESLRVKP